MLFRSGKKDAIITAKVTGPDGTTGTVNVLYNEKTTYIDYNALQQFERKFTPNPSPNPPPSPSPSPSPTPSPSVDYRTLADQYGANSYQSFDGVLTASEVEVIARAIYGELTSGDGQLDVAWVMINRVLAEMTGFFTAKGKRTTLLNVVTHKDAFTALRGDGGNTQSWTSKTSSDAGWVNAVTLAFKMVEILGNYYPTSGHTNSEKANIRNEVAGAIGASPIGTRTHYHSTGDYDRYVIYANGKQYIGGTEIDNEIIDRLDMHGHVYFNYGWERKLTYGT